MKDTRLGSIKKQKVGVVHYTDEKEGKGLEVNDNLQWEKKDPPAISRFSQTLRSQEKVLGNNLAHYGANGGYCSPALSIFSTVSS